MNCPLLREETADVLLEYSAGRLARAEASAVQRHALVCDDCAEFLSGQADVWAALDTWRVPEVSPGFDQRLWQRLRFRAWKPSFSLAAAAIVIITGFTYDHKTPVAPIRTGTVSITDIDQVERTLDDMQLLHQFEAARSL